MVFTGFNPGKNGSPRTWQVENSWGADEKKPGKDGYLAASDHWFQENVTSLVVPREILSRRIQRCLESEPVKLDPWSLMAPALRVMSPMTVRQRVEGMTVGRYMQRSKIS